MEISTRTAAALIIVGRQLCTSRHNQRSQSWGISNGSANTPSTAQIERKDVSRYKLHSETTIRLRPSWEVFYRTNFGFSFSFSLPQTTVAHDQGVISLHKLHTCRIYPESSCLINSIQRDDQKIDLALACPAICVRITVRSCNVMIQLRIEHIRSAEPVQRRLSLEELVHHRVVPEIRHAGRIHVRVDGDVHVVYIQIGVQ